MDRKKREDLFDKIREEGTEIARNHPRGVAREPLTSIHARLFEEHNAECSRDPARLDELVDEGLILALKSSEIKAISASYTRKDTDAVEASNRKAAFSNEARSAAFASIALATLLTASGTLADILSRWTGNASLLPGLDFARQIIVVLATLGIAFAGLSWMNLYRLRKEELLDEWQDRRHAAEKHRWVLFEALATLPRHDTSAMDRFEYFNSFLFRDQKLFFEKRKGEHRADARSAYLFSSIAILVIMVAEGVTGILGASMGANWTVVAGLAVIAKAFSDKEINKEAENQSSASAKLYTRALDELEEIGGEIDGVREALEHGDLRPMEQMVAIVIGTLETTQIEWMRAFEDREIALDTLRDQIEAATGGKGKRAPSASPDWRARSRARSAAPVERTGTAQSTRSYSLVCLISREGSALGGAVRSSVDDLGLSPLLVIDPAEGRHLRDRALLSEILLIDSSVMDRDVTAATGMREAIKPGKALVLRADQSDEPVLDGFQCLEHGDLDIPDARLGFIVSLRDALAEMVSGQGREVIDPGLRLLLEESKSAPVARLETDLFRERVGERGPYRRALARARRNGDLTALRQIEHRFSDLLEVDAVTLVDLLLSYRALSAHEEMACLVIRFPAVLAHTSMVRHQYAFALGRLRRWEEAEKVLEKLSSELGPDSETLGLMGRLLKDQWQDAREKGEHEQADRLLVRAIETYRQGFETDWRDAFPGINAVTLMEIEGSPEMLEQQEVMLPVVRYAAERRLMEGRPDYWDHATLLEVAVLARDEAAARESLADALASESENWQLETTHRNLVLIAAARDRRFCRDPWLTEILGALLPA